jgi:hypothetical protein
MIFSSSHKAREWEAKFQRLYSLFFPLRHWLKWMANILKIGIIGITIHAYAAPTITTNLANKVAISGTAISLQISAYDIAPISYQWHHNNADIQAATNAILTFSSVDPTNAGRYSVTVTNSSGSMTSRTATLTVMSYPKPTTIVAWGDNSYGQTNTPLMETNVVALAGGQLQTVFLRQDGTLGDFGNAIASPSTYSLLPHVAAVATEGFYGLALGIDGTPVSYGLTYYSGSSDVPAYVTNAVETAIGNPRLALLDNGTLVGWVPNPNYYYPSDPAHILSYIVNLSNVVAIATSGGGVNTGSHCLALKSDHTVVAFGVSQVGDSIVVPSLTNVVAISGGASFSLALKIDGTVTAWGDNSYGQTNVPSGLSNVMAIATGDNHSLALKSNGTVVAWGDNSYGQCNVPVTLSNVVLVTAGSRHSAALTKQPKIVVPPQSRFVLPGWQVVFNVVATGYEWLNFQWSLNGTNIVGATNATLTLTNVPLTSAGIYQCGVSNAFGTCVSLPATLNVYRTTPYFGASSSGLQWTNGSFGLTLNWLSGHGPAILYGSTNLLIWVPIFTNPPIIGSLQLLDPAATNFPFRFYRAIEQ